MYNEYNTVVVQPEVNEGLGMDVYYCGQCRMMIAPHARYCSVCGSVVRPRIPFWRTAWSQVVWIFQRMMAIYVVWVALRVAFPLVLVVTPVCGASPAMVGVAARQLGTVQAFVGLVGGESLLVARPCAAPTHWYASTRAPSWIVALLARDTQTWQGWILAIFDDGVTAAEQMMVDGVRSSVATVRGFLFDIRTW